MFCWVRVQGPAGLCAGGVVARHCPRTRKGARFCVDLAKEALKLKTGILTLPGVGFSPWHYVKIALEV